MLKFMRGFLKLCIAIVCVSSKSITRNKENKENLIETLRRKNLNHSKNGVAELSANICAAIINVIKSNY